MPLSSDPHAEIYAACRRFAETLHRPHRAARVIVFLDDGTKALDATVPSGGAAAEGQASASGGGSLKPPERRILKAVAGMDEDNPTASEIAKTAKMANDPTFRKYLSTMRQKGLLGGDKGDQGYPITPLGMDAITPNDDP